MAGGLSKNGNVYFRGQSDTIACPSVQHVPAGRIYFKKGIAKTDRRVYTAFDSQYLEQLDLDDRVCLDRIEAETTGEFR